MSIHDQSMRRGLSMLVQKTSQLNDSLFNIRLGQGLVPHYNSQQIVLRFRRVKQSRKALGQQRLEQRHIE